MNGTPTLSEVVKFIKFVVTRCDDGLAILLGNVDPPSSVMLYELKRGAQTEYGVRIDGGDDVPKAQNILENRAEEIVGYLGGWKNINQAFNAYRAQYPETWTLFEMCALFVRPGGEFRDGKGGAMSMIGQKYDGIVPKTVRRRRDKIIKSIALYLITHPHFVCLCWENDAGKRA